MNTTNPYQKLEMHVMNSINKINTMSDEELSDNFNTFYDLF